MSLSRFTNIKICTNKVQLNKLGTSWVWDLLEDTVFCLRYLCMNLRDSSQHLSTTVTDQKTHSYHVHTRQFLLNSNSAEELYQWQIFFQTAALNDFQYTPLEITSFSQSNCVLPVLMQSLVLQLEKNPRTVHSHLPVN